MTNQKIYEFTLVMSGVDPMDENFPNTVYELGGTDATISSRSGVVYVSFSRKSASLMDAIFSAIHNVEMANPKGTVVRVDDANLLNQAQIGELVGKTRQMVNQYISGKKGPGGFPAPACEFSNGKRLWDWSSTSLWFFQAGLLNLEQCKDAELIRAINNQLESRVLGAQNPKMVGEITKRMMSRPTTSKFPKRTIRQRNFKTATRPDHHPVG